MQAIYKLITGLLLFTLVAATIPLFVIGIVFVLFIGSVIFLFTITYAVLETIVMTLLGYHRDKHVHNWENKALGLAQCVGDDGCGDIKEIN